MKESYLENEYVELWVENGIIMEIFKPHIKDITLEMAKTVVRDRLIVSNKVTMPIFIDMGNLRLFCDRGFDILSKCLCRSVKQLYQLDIGKAFYVF
jgi:hypothetical protein